MDKTILFNNIFIDSPKLYATIQKNGKINLENIIPKTAKVDKQTSSNKTTLLTIILRKLNIKNGKIKFSDLRENKNFTMNLGPYSFMAHDISTKKGEINAYTFKTLINGNGKLFWQGGMSINPLKIYGEVHIDNLNLPNLYAYALPNFNTSLDKGSISLTLPYQINFLQVSYTLSTILNKKTDIKISGDVMREPLSLNSKVQLSNLMLILKLKMRV